jgi:hypothetical protein
MARAGTYIPRKEIEMITPLPTPPSTANPASFSARADAFMAALPQFVTEANALAVAMNLNSTTDTSTTSDTIAVGATSLTVSAGKSFQPGMYLVIADTAAPSTNSMYGQITSYNSGTGALVMNILSVLGSGTKTAWTISQSATNMDIAGTINGATNKATPVAADALGIWDSVTGLLNKLTLTNLVAYLATLFAPWPLTSITASLGGSVPLSVASTFYTGPTVAQGTVGKWFVSGQVNVYDSNVGSNNFTVKLWDGTTILAQSTFNCASAIYGQCSLSGVISAPAGNLRISVEDTSTTFGSIISGCITALRIG